MMTFHKKSSRISDNDDDRDPRRAKFDRALSLLFAIAGRNPGITMPKPQELKDCLREHLELAVRSLSEATTPPQGEKA